MHATRHTLVPTRRRLRYVLFLKSQGPERDRCPLALESAATRNHLIRTVQWKRGGIAVVLAGPGRTEHGREREGETRREWYIRAQRNDRGEDVLLYQCKWDASVFPLIQIAV